MGYTGCFVRLCAFSASPPVDVTPIGHWGALLPRSERSAARRGPALWSESSLAGRRAGRQAGNSAAVRRKRLELHRVCLGGGMTPTGVKEEGSVRRRKEEKKTPANLTKLPRNSAKDGRPARGRRRQTRSLMDSMSLRLGQLSPVDTSTPALPPQ